MIGRLSACPAQAGRLEKTGGVLAGIRGGFFGPRTTQMPADRLPQ